MSLTSLDVVILLAYLLGITLLGIRAGGKQHSSRDYFLSSRAIPWWAVCAAIVATETSALTFISIPGLAYISDWNFLQLAFGYIVGRIVVATIFLPAYFDGKITTAYEFLEQRFGARMRRSASMVFMGTRTFADGVRLYTTAIPLALLFKGSPFMASLGPDITYPFAIVLLTGLTMVYVFMGGVRAVIWTDVVQLCLYLFGAVASIIILFQLIPGGTAVLFTKALTGKLHVFNSGWGLSLSAFFSEPYTFVASFLGGAFLSMASHGTDQIIIQRVLATNDVAAGKKAMVWSGLIILVQFALFLLVGTLLYAFYGNTTISSNEIFPLFILEHMPPGVTGLIIAGLLAAAMSTLSGSISALSSTTVMDIVVPLSGRSWNDRALLTLSRRMSLVWAFVLAGAAMIFIQTPRTVVELALSIASYTYGGLLGTFLLGVFYRQVKETAAMVGFFTGIISMTLVISFTSIAWTWYTLIGVIVTIAVGLISHRYVLPGRNRRQISPPPDLTDGIEE